MIDTKVSFIPLEIYCQPLHRPPPFFPQQGCRGQGATGEAHEEGKAIEKPGSPRAMSTMLSAQRAKHRSRRIHTSRKAVGSGSFVLFFTLTMMGESSCRRHSSRHSPATGASGQDDVPTGRKKPVGSHEQGCHAAPY